MTRLADLHKRLARLQRRRQRVRWETAYSALLLAVLWILAAAFLVDWLFEMNRPQRLVLLLISAGIVVWAFRRFTLPWLGQQETELDMALLVEKEEHIDSDLVAAMQFESPEAPEWGSIQLEQAVIDGIATKGKQINVMRGLSREELSRRSKLLLVTAIAWVLIVILLYGHVGVFLNRLLLGVMHYPTQTRIESITISGREISNPIHPGSEPLMLQYGEPLKFEIRCSGTFPEQGAARLAAAHSGLRTTLTLHPVDADATQPGGDDEIRTYVAALPRLVDSVEYRIFIGDAWTEPGQLGVGRLPNVEPELVVEPPIYAKTDPKAKPITMPSGLRQISVIEGSQVRVNVYSDKPLKEAAVTLAEKQDDGTIVKNPYAMACANPDSSPQKWSFEPPENSPLFAVTEPVRYSLQVTDTDGLSLEEPIEGTIRIQADSPPSFKYANSVTKYVLPVGKPTIDFHVMDDYGVASLVLNRKVIRANGEVIEDQSKIYEPSGGVPEKGIEKTYQLDLTSLNSLKLKNGDPLELEKGDEVQIVLRAVDFRGPRPGEAALTEPLVFQVTDEAGILEHLTEADRDSARQLRVMIQRQLGIGESP